MQQYLDIKVEAEVEEFDTRLTTQKYIQNILINSPTYRAPLAVAQNSTV